MNKYEEKLFRYKDYYYNKYDEVSKIKELIVKYDYSKGGKMYYRGIYTPSLYWQLFSAKKLGKEVTYNCKYDYKYGFDNNNQLIYTFKEGEKEEFIIHNQDEIISLYYNVYNKELSELAICEYELNCLKVYYQAYVIPLLNRDDLGFYGEIYTYTDNILSEIDVIQKAVSYGKEYHSVTTLNSKMEVLSLTNWSK